MQAIPDKDFNQAFQEKFDTFEVEPSAAVWKAIVSDLDEGKKRPFPVWQLMAAASVIVILGAGLWLSGPKQRVRLQGKEQELTTITDETPKEDLSPVSEQKQVLTIAKKQTTPAYVVPVEKNEPAATSTDEIKIQVAQDVPKAVEKKSPVQDVVLAKQDVQVSKERKEPQPSELVMALVSDEAMTADSERSSSHKRERSRAGILGNVINYVVGKVDPREEKLIHFTKDDDGGNEVSGINLGVVKLIKNRQ